MIGGRRIRPRRVRLHLATAVEGETIPTMIAMVARSSRPEYVSSPLLTAALHAATPVYAGKGFLQPQGLSSGAFEAMRAFAVATARGGSKVTGSDLLAGRLPGPPQPATAKTLLAAHNVQNKHSARLVAIEDAARWLNDLPVPTFKLSRLRPALRVVLQLLDVGENPLHQRPRCRWVVEGNVISDSIKVGKCGLCPDYFSHRCIRDLASACETTRPSSTARSPRAMPSRIRIRACNFS